MTKNIHLSKNKIKYLDINEIINTLKNTIYFKDINYQNIIKHNILYDSKLSNNFLNDNQITNIPVEGIIIDKPGNYIFKNNIIWNPLNINNITAITITSDNVTLDLNNFYLKNKHKKSNNFIVAINTNNLKNIVIKNGNIYDFTYYGIYMNNCENINIDNIKVIGLRLNNLNIRNLTPTGILLNNCRLFNINNCNVYKIKVTSDSCAGIQIVNSIIGQINNCKCKCLKNYDGAVQGFSTLLSIDIKIINCKSKYLKSYFNNNILTTGHTVLGFAPILSAFINIIDCKAKNLYGSCDDCHGCSLFLVIYSEVNNFYANKVYDGISKSNSGAKATGLEVYGFEIKINNSFVENIYAINPQDKQSTGFSIAGENVEFNKCKSKNIKAIKNKNVCNCKGEKLDDNSNINKDKYSDIFGIGFGWAPDPRPEFRNIHAKNIIYNDCIAEDCKIGFDTWLHNTSIWNNIISINCKTCISIKNNEKRTLSCNPCSECNPAIIVTLSNLSFDNTFINPQCFN